MSDGRKEHENGRFRQGGLTEPYKQRFFMDDISIKEELSVEEYLQKLILDPRTPNNVSEYLVKVREQLIKSKQ